MRHIRFLLPILLVGTAAFVAGNASGSVGNPARSPTAAAQSWKVCLDERIADYVQRDIAARPELNECFRQP
jgi:hypothetical protein